ncbi:MAG: replication initiator protein A [Gemmataceae bacterium]
MTLATLDPLDPLDLSDGRDEMNLADFPLAALTRTQKTDGERKLDRLEFTASRFDATLRRRVQQKVTLTSTTREGLPTPADEHVILALLHLAKHRDDFAEPTVPFYPAQLFQIMRWEPNGRSYTRLREVLRRLKAVTIRYENAWWDAEGRAYEEEMATSIIAAYKIGRQTAGPRKAEPCSWITWGPHFYDSLRKGNLKRLDLEVFFSLRTPTAQRMYRFLDKRFYRTTELAFDLVEFACGHIGLTDPGNVALIKRRLQPALDELEQIGFLQPEKQRFVKVRQGQWRIVLRSTKAQQHEKKAVTTESPVAPQQSPAEPLTAEQLAWYFRHRWGAGPPPGTRDREQARQLLQGYGTIEARAVVELLVEITRQAWPECRSLSGAISRYLPEALAARQAAIQRDKLLQEQQLRRQQERQTALQQDQSLQTLQARWDALPAEVRAAIETRVRQRAGLAPEMFIHRLCLDEMLRN